jgi:hypothetical protein
MKESKVSDDLDKLVKKLLKEANRQSTDEKPGMNLEEKLKVLDRAMKLEQIKARMNEGDFGSGFDDDDGGK